MDGGQKNKYRTNCNGQLVLRVRGERWPRRIVSRQRNQTLAHIIIELNDGANGTISKRTVQRSLPRMGIRPTTVPLLTALHRAALFPGQKNTET
ncbi:HTH_Tnp_Tc3_2 domain-containing protein [Trichonephila clavipes]|nr:HTH_Tnp_Tc3_2 domain-containing protein [Trichonephila clavipes]